VSVATRGEHAAVFAFDEGLPALFARAENLGMPFREHLESGRSRVRQVDPVEISPDSSRTRCASPWSTTTRASWFSTA
jgi:circadian clock protein KaiC